MSGVFNSPFAEELRAFLVFKRALGYSYQRAEFTLRSFDRFVQQHAKSDHLTDLQQIILEWLGSTRGRKPVSVASELAVLREFCRFLRRTDSNVLIPARDWASQSTESQFLPYIFTKDQIHRLLELAREIPGPPVRMKTIRSLILILYCTGLRLGEAVRLQLQDVDLAQTRFFVRNSKRKSRWVPFHEDLAEELQDYRTTRDRLASKEPNSAFFVRIGGVPLSVSSASNTLRSLFRKAGIKPPKGRSGPRPYDLRHTYAVHRLTSWYHGDVDVQSCLPWLSAYMGHEDLSGTEKYLTATPELLAIAASRFELRLRGISNGQTSTD